MRSILLFLPTVLFGFALQAREIPVADAEALKAAAAAAVPGDVLVMRSGESSFASPSSRFVSPLIADGTTIIWWPARAHLATRLATLRMRSVDPIEVPPYL